MNETDVVLTGDVLVSGSLFVMHRYLHGTVDTSLNVFRTSYQRLNRFRSAAVNEMQNLNISFDNSSVLTQETIDLVSAMNDSCISFFDQVAYMANKYESQMDTVQQIAKAPYSMLKLTSDFYR